MYKEVRAVHNWFYILSFQVIWLESNLVCRLLPTMEYLHLCGAPSNNIGRN